MKKHSTSLSLCEDFRKLSLPLREGGPLAVDECYTPEVYFLPLGKLLLSGHFYHSSVILEQVLECHLPSREGLGRVRMYLEAYLAISEILAFPSG